MKVQKSQEYFVYFKNYELHSCAGRSAVRRRRFIRRFPKY